MTDLDKLIEAVEAGTLCQGEIMSQAHGDLIDACFPLLDDDVGAWEYVALAMDGSLDAAKRLHDALLPGWKWDVTLHAASVEEPNRRFSPQFPMEGLWSGTCDDPARAWFLAILRAVKAKG